MYSSGWKKNYMEFNSCLCSQVRDRRWENLRMKNKDRGKSKIRQRVNKVRNLKQRKDQFNEDFS